MLGDAQVSPAAALLADPARAAMLWALSDGRALPAGELARVARVGAPTASAHLARLTAGGLLTCEPHGRHRYYRLAEPAVVAALEALAVIAPPLPGASPKIAHTAAIRRARTCYDHLAGALGVRLAEALVLQGCLVLEGPASHVTETGVERLSRLGIDVAALTSACARSRRPLARACLDWSERRYHVAGGLGTALLNHVLHAGWIERTPGSRAVRVTNEGRRAFRREFDILTI